LVSYVRGLYERFRQLIHEGLKFAIVGMIGVIITDGGANLLRAHYHMGWLSATVISTLVATCFAYVASRYWTFRNRVRTTVRRETVQFFVLNGIGLIIQLVPLAFTTHVLDKTASLPANIALALGIILGTLFRFWSYRKWVWTSAEPAGPPAAESLEELVLTPPPGAAASSGDEAGQAR
jgi:putative flippase GtrA